MSDLFVGLHMFLARRRWLVLLLTAIFLLSALLCARKLKINEDFTDMLPMSDRAIAEQVEALRHVRQADRVFINVQTTADDPERLLQAADMMHDALQQISDLAELRYKFDTSEAGEVIEELQARLPVLLTASQLRELESKLETAALEERLAWMKKAMSQPHGLMLKNVVQTDPAGFSDAVFEQLRALQAGLGDVRIAAGRITSADGRHVLISAVPKFRPADLQRSAELVPQLLRAAREVEAAFTSGTVRVAITGAHRMALENAETIRKDTALTSVTAMLAVAGLMFAAFRQRSLALLGLAPTLFGALGAVIVFYLTGDPVSAVALGCGSILIGVTVDYGIAVLYHSDDSLPANREQLARRVAQFIPTLAFCALTTMAAFLVMFVSPVSGHRQLGLFGIVAVSLAALFAMVVLPLFVPVRAGGAARVLPLTAVMQRLFDWRDRKARLVLPLLLIFSVCCVAGVLRLRFDGDFARLNGATPEAQRDEQVVREVWGKGLSLTTVVVTGSGRDEALRKNEQVWAVLRALQEKGAVESFASIAPLMPSEQTRQANLRAWSSFWSETRRQTFSHALAAAATNLGFRTSAFIPFLDRATPAISMSAPEDRATSALERLAADFWSEEEERVSICTLVQTGDGGSFIRLRRAIQKEAPEAMLLDKAALSEELIRVAKRALPVFAVMVVLLNAVLLFLLLGRVELVAITLLPMAAGVFWTLGVLGLSGQPINIANFIFAIFVIGVGGDYSLFMVMAELDRLRGRPDRTASTGGAVTICAGTTLLGMGVLVLAEHPAMFSIGLSAWLGITFTLLAALFLVPACMARLRERERSSAESLQEGTALDVKSRRQFVRRLYRYQGIFVEQYVFWKLRTDPLFRAMEEVVPRHGHILDIGCGYGLVAHWLALGAPQRSVHGLDHDPGKVRVAQASARRFPRLRFEEGDLLLANWPACDVVLLCDVLHYFPRELKAHIIQRAFDVLRPGGSVIVRDACSEASLGHRAVAMAERVAVWLGQNKSDRGLHFETAAGYGLLLEEAGFMESRRLPEAGLGSNMMVAAQKPVRAAVPADGRLT
jgi:uncharacterized protein